MRIKKCEISNHRGEYKCRDLCTLKREVIIITRYIVLSRISLHFCSIFSIVIVLAMRKCAQVASKKISVIGLKISVSRNKQLCCKSKSLLVRPRALIQSNTRYKIYFVIDTVHVHYRFSRFTLSRKTPIKFTITYQYPIYLQYK